MQITPTNYTVADYCTAMTRHEITVNRDYQRSDQVWPPRAKAFLIETVLLEYPIPKLSLYQVTDVKSRKTIKEIVDGQQRSQAILDFYNDKFPLSRESEIPELSGKLYSQLDPEYQHRFLDYSLSIDLFVSATPDEIREVFRRINSYTIPLNPEELRHSRYQGKFKWFIYKLSKQYDQNLFDMSIFNQKELIRMADGRLFSEIIHALLNGITKTNPSKLEGLYKDYDKDFLMEKEIEDRIKQAIECIVRLKEIHKGPLMKPHNFYALVLAFSHMRNPVTKFMSMYEPQRPYVYDQDIVLTNLTGLAESLENPEMFDGKFKGFYLATLGSRHGEKDRKMRFMWFCKALEPTLL